MTQSHFASASIRGRRSGPAAVGALMAALLGFGAMPAQAADCGAMAEAQIDWEGCNKGSLILRSSMLDGANLKGTNVSFTDLRDSSLLATNFEEAVMMRSSIAGSKADKANFAGIEGYRTIFSNVSAQGASFANAEVQRADFTGADLTNTDFSKAELGRANFTDANITGAKFNLANLARAGINKAKFDGPLDLTGAFMLLTRLDGMDMTQIQGLQQWQMDQACGDDRTKLPEGLKPGAKWPCKAN